MIGLHLRLALALWLVIICVPTVEAEPNDGAITGQIVNKTAEGAAPSDISVRLVTFGRKQQAALGERMTVSDTSGHYAFSDLERDPNLVYVPFVQFADVTYRSDQLAQLQDQPAWQLDIAVYESTTDDRAIQFDRLGLVLTGTDQGRLHFMEMGGLLNGGDRTFVGTNPQVVAAGHAVRLPLPKGALGIQMESGFTDQHLSTGAGGLQLTSPVPPGLHDFALSFQLPYAGSGADITLQLPYPTQSYSIYLPETGPRLDATALVAGGSVQLGDQSYVVYGGSSLPRSAILAGHITGRDGTPVLDASQLTMVGLGLVFFVLATTAWLFAVRSARARGEARSRGAHPGQARHDLLLHIAQLDERFAAGEVRRAEYVAERSVAKQRLQELTTSSKRGRTRAI